MSYIQAANIKFKDAHTRIDIPVAGSLAFTANSANALYLSNSLVTIPGARDLVVSKDVEVTGNITMLDGRLHSNSYSVLPSLLFGNANTGMTYATRTANVVIEANQVTITGNIFLSAKGSSVGPATILHYGVPNISNGGLVSCYCTTYLSFAANTRLQGGFVVGPNANVNLYMPDILVIGDAQFTNASQFKYMLRYNTA